MAGGPGRAGCKRGRTICAGSAQLAELQDNAHQDVTVILQRRLSRVRTIGQLSEGGLGVQNAGCVQALLFRVSVAASVSVRRRGDYLARFGHIRLHAVLSQQMGMHREAEDDVVGICQLS